MNFPPREGDFSLRGLLEMYDFYRAFLILYFNNSITSGTARVCCCTEVAASFKHTGGGALGFCCCCCCLNISSSATSPDGGCAGLLGCSSLLLMFLNVAFFLSLNFPVKFLVFDVFYLLHSISWHFA